MENADLYAAFDFRVFAYRFRHRYVKISQKIRTCFLEKIEKRDKF